MLRATVTLGCLAALLLAARQTGAFEFTSCDRGAGKLLTAVIKGCEGAKGAACQLKVGDTFNINTTFVTHNPFAEATIFLDVEVDEKFTHVAKGPACQLGISCPSPAEQPQSLALQLQIPDNFAGLGPRFRLKVTTRKRDEFCVQFPLNIEG